MEDTEDEESFECLVNTCEREFTSEWGRSRHLASHDEDVVEQIYIETLQVFADVIGRAPKIEEMDEYGPFSAVSYYNRFGSWTGALVEAGLPPNYNTLGETEKVDYGDNWEEQQWRARIRDDNECRICSTSAEDIGVKKMPVHHISPCREYGAHTDDQTTDYEAMNGLENLITLCPSCHKTFEGRWQDHSPVEFEQLAQDHLDSLKVPDEPAVASD